MTDNNLWRLALERRLNASEKWDISDPRVRAEVRSLHRQYWWERNRIWASPAIGFAIGSMGVLLWIFLA